MVVPDFGSSSSKSEIQPFFSEIWPSPAPAKLLAGFRVQKNPGFFKKAQPWWFFLGFYRVLLGFRFYWVFWTRSASGCK